MRHTRLALTAAVALTTGAALPGCAARDASPVIVPPPGLAARIDHLLDSPALDGALFAIHAVRLHDGQVIYSRHADQRVMPASSLKLVTAAVAAERLGWDYRFETRLEATGRIENGVLDGDLIVTGTGDPTIEARDLRTAPLFDAWADALLEAGIRTVTGRLIGDDNAFDDEPIGAGWAWDYLTAAYAPPAGALNYNGNLAAVRVQPPDSRELDGRPRVTLAPPGHGLEVEAQLTAVAPRSPPSLTLTRLPGVRALVVRGEFPTGGAPFTTATTVPNPTGFLVEALRLALAARGIHVSGGAHDIDDVPPPTGTRRLIARHESLPLRAIVATMLKGSPNLYGEVLFKAIGREAERRDVTTSAAARTAIADTLAGWGVAEGRLVMYDGSGLSRYNYVTAGLLVQVLEEMWRDERHRAAFAAALPVSGHDGTLASRMTGSLRRRVQAKTGTINNVRALAGYLEPDDGQRLAFAMIANHFVAPSAAVDEVMEDVLAEIGAGQEQAGAYSSR